VRAAAHAGPAVGDEALRRCADAIRALLPATHLFGRLGGEGFALLAPGCNHVAADQRAETLRSTVDALRFPPPGPDLRITVSIGLALASDGAQDLDALLRVADDRRLFEAERNGRNRIGRPRRGA
jgi:diguanylate cyclase (GGDEF)-like protein